MNRGDCTAEIMSKWSGVAFHQQADLADTLRIPLQAPALERMCTQEQPGQVKPGVGHFCVFLGT